MKFQFSPSLLSTVFRKIVDLFVERIYLGESVLLVDRSFSQISHGSGIDHVSDDVLLDGLRKSLSLVLHRLWKIPCPWGHERQSFHIGRIGRVLGLSCFVRYFCASWSFWCPKRLKRVSFKFILKKNESVKIFFRKKQEVLSKCGLIFKSKQ